MKIWEKVRNAPLRVYQDVFPGCQRSVAQLFDLPEEVELDLEQVLDENWYPNSP